MNFKKRIFILLLPMLYAWGGFAQETYSVQLNLAPNLKVPSRASQLTEQIISLPGQGENKSKVTSTFEFVYSVVGKNEDNYKIHCVINRITQKVEIDGKIVADEDSDKDEAPSEYFKTSKELVKKVVEAEITPAFVLVGDLKPITEGLTADKAKSIFAFFEQFIGNAYIKDPVTINEVKETKENNDGMDVTTKVQLKNVTEHTYQVESFTDITGELQGIPLKGQGNGNYEIDRATGVTIFGLMTSNVSGSASTPAGVINISNKVTASVEFVQ